MKYDVGTVDLDWKALKPVEGRANSGIEVLAEEMEDGWEVVAVWYETGPYAGARALIRRPSKTNGRIAMTGWAVTFLIIALIAGVLGFSGVAGAAANVAWIVFVVGLVLAAVMFIAGPKQPESY